MDLSLVTQSALILIREGAEALLIIGAIVAFLTKANERARVRGVLTGAGLAVLASIATAWVFNRFFGGNHNDVFEGIIMAVAAGLLFYVSGWLFLRQDPRAWQGYLREQAHAALGRGSLALASIGFLAVYREGAETVLFLQALAVSKDGWSVSLFAGLAAGAGALAVVYMLIQAIALRVPMRPLFIATSAFLFFTGLGLVGNAMTEFQEMQWLPLNNAPGAAALQAIGLNPSIEILAAQLTICLIAAASFFVLSRRRAQSI
jgi:high-affinity iron transporter